MSAHRDRRKQERTRTVASRGGKPTSAEETTTQRMIEQVSVAAAQAATPHLAAARASGGDASAAADAVRGLALRVMQRSTLDGRHECRAGCVFCCHTAVTVSPPEAFAIVRHLAQHCTPDERAAVRDRLEANAALAASRSRDTYIAELVPCGLLLADGNCRVHPVRPLACASFLSTSRSACEAEFQRTPGRDPIPTDRFAMLVGLGSEHGLRAACAGVGLDGEFYELHHALLRVLGTPDVEARWARGEPVFEGCLR